MKLCSRCDTRKSLSEFIKNKARKDGVSVYCRDCTKKYMVAKEYDRKRWQNDRDEESQRSRLYRQQNAERLAEYWREKQTRRRKEHPEKVLASNAQRKIAERRSIPSWANIGSIRLMYAKAKELSARLGVDFQVDHVVPLRSKLVCGLHCEANLQLLASDINHRKRNYEWPDMP